MAPESYADLEIGLHRRHSGGFTVELRLSQPESETEDQLASSEVAAFDLDALRQAESEPERYGQLLAASLFADPAVREKFAVATSLQQPLRLRLLIGPSAPELHDLRWETLRHPGDNSPLITGERLLFSRYLSSADWRTVRPRPRQDLRALVAIANPTKGVGTGPNQWPLAEIDVGGEQKRAADALGAAIPMATAAEPVSLDTLTAQVRADCPDILYLVCHGARPGGEPVVFLEGAEDEVVATPAGELAQQLRQLEDQPRLVVLASCRSAGGDRLAGEGGALAALGPRLAEAGIPAVVAMQGEVTLRTIERFMPVFFSELREHGQIDRAMAIARNAVRDEPDAWMPVLFLRLKSGRIWYVPGFAEEEGSFEKWPSLLNAIKEGRCTPILGPGLTEAVFGARRETARRWAEAYHFPLAPHNREDLPQVAQFLTITKDPMFPLGVLQDQMKQELLRRYRGEPPPGLADATVSEIATAVGKQQREADAAEPHRVLASLPLPIYITTNPDNLLADALRDANKDPQIELFRWSTDPGIEWPPSIYDGPAADYQPSPQQPLVYHLFGNLDQPDTLVLTEDNYFDYLIGATLNRKLIPPAVLKALTAHALLFVGFQMDDWDFRVLFRSIVSREGEVARRRFFHVGVQVSPEEGRFLEADAARNYLDRYFEWDKISLYWGSAEDFARELLQQQTSAQPGQ
jgi:hypothetical protein